MPLTLVKYDAARAALEACASVDEVKDWADTAAAYEAYARQSKDNDLRKMAIDIRMRAKRRLGEMMAAQKASGRMKKAGRPAKLGSAVTPISLAEAGIDKRLARESRAAAALSPEAFESAVEDKKAAVDAPPVDFETGYVELHSDADADEALATANAELLELAAEAMTIVDSDDRLRAAMDEIAKAKRETKAISALYDSVCAEMSTYKREASRWMRKAKKSALCKACKAGLESE